MSSANDIRWPLASRGRKPPNPMREKGGDGNVKNSTRACSPASEVAP